MTRDNDDVTSMLHQISVMQIKSTSSDEHHVDSNKDPFLMTNKNNNELCQLTGEDVETRLPVLRRVSVGRVADDHAGLPDGSVPDQHAADQPGLQLVLPGQRAGGRGAGLLGEVVHVGGHVGRRIQRLEAHCGRLLRLVRL